MTKEHKKLYKAGKNWIAATITVATVAVFGGLATLNAHADSTTQVQKLIQVLQLKILLMSLHKVLRLITSMRNKVLIIVNLFLKPIAII